MTDEELQREREAAYRLGVEEGLAMAREVSVERDKALAEVERLREEVDAVRSELIDVLSAHGEPVEKWSGRGPN